MKSNHHTSIGILLFTLCLLLNLTSCSNEEKINHLNERLGGLGDTLTQLTYLKSMYTGAIDSCNQEIQNIEEAISNQSIAHQLYLDQHQGAVNSIIAGGKGLDIATDFKIDYPQWIVDLSEWTILFAGGYYLFHINEVNAVLDEHDNNKQIIERKNAEIQNIKNIKDELNNKVSEVDFSLSYYLGEKEKVEVELDRIK